MLCFVLIWLCGISWLIHVNYLPTLLRIASLLHFFNADEVTLDSLWSNDAIWLRRPGSTLAQVMACLTAPSHYLNECWLIIKSLLWYPPVYYPTRSANWYVFGDYTFRFITTSPRVQWVDISMVCCQEDLTRHAYAWQIGPFWQDTLDMGNVSNVANQHQNKGEQCAYYGVYCGNTTIGYRNLWCDWKRFKCYYWLVGIYWVMYLPWYQCLIW